VDIFEEIREINDKIQDVSSRYIENLFQETIDRWSFDYPRHDFMLMIAHGGIMMSVNPKVGGQEDPRFIDKRHRLQGEAIALADHIMDINDAIEYSGLCDTRMFKTRRND
jgi:hypothetical protein